LLTSESLSPVAVGLTERKAMSFRSINSETSEIRRALAYERRLVRVAPGGAAAGGGHAAAEGSAVRLVRAPRKVPTRGRAQPRLWTRSFAMALLAGNTYGYAFSSFILLPVFMVDRLGSSPVEIGNAAAAFGLAAVGVTPLVARIVDRVGRARLLALGAAVLALTSLAFVAVDSYGPLLLALRALQGAAFSLVLAAMPTLVSEIAPASRLGEALGLSGASMLVMNAAAPAVGEPLAAAFGWKPIFVLAAVAAAASTLVALRIPSRNPEVSESALTAVFSASAPARPEGLLAVLRQPVFAAYAQITTLCALTFGTMFTFLAPWILAHEIGRVSDFFAAYAVAAVGIRLVAGQVPDRFGRRRVAIGMMTVYAFVPPAALLVDSTGGLLLLGAVFGGAHGLMHPSLNAMALAAAATRERGRVMALFSGAFSVGAWGGGLVFGPIAESFGYEVVFALGGMCCFGGLAILLGARELADAVAPEATS
jgi:MFS family permease